MNKEPLKKSGCGYFETLIHKRLDGEISPEENIELDQHLADCPECLDDITSYAMVKDLIDQSIENPVEVPEGFFENLAEQLDDLKPARGISGILAHPFFNAYRNMALAATSLILVAFLTASVSSGLFSKNDNNNIGKSDTSHSKALILTNSGDQIIITGDEGDTDHYSRALDDLERAYREAMGSGNTNESGGYIHTSWSGGESATPIH